MTMALEGVRVLDVTTGQQGPSAAAYLADMGAEVIKLEDPARGDGGRFILSILGSHMDGTDEKGINYYFETHNRNKKGIAVNLKTAGGKQVAYRLVAKSDVFLSNRLPITLKELGLDYETLTKYRPDIVYAVASAYGAKGPEKDNPANDGAAQARSGWMSLVTTPGNPLGDGGLGSADQVGAITLALGAMMALFARERTGLGQEVHCSLLGSAVSIQAMWINSYLLAKTLPTRPLRTKARNPLFNWYQGKDGRWFMFAVPAPQTIWSAFCKVVEMPQLETPEFAPDETGIGDKGPKVVAVLDKVFAQRPTAEWVKRLKDAGIVCDLVQTYAEVANDPQVLANEYIIDVDHPIAGRIKMVGIPYALSKTPGKVRTGAPVFGQHTEEVLIEVGGYTWEELARLKQEGAIL